MDMRNHERDWIDATAALMDIRHHERQYVEYLREVKRWLEAEERAVLTALKKKEDDRVCVYTYVCAWCVFWRGWT